MPAPPDYEPPCLLRRKPSLHLWNAIPFGGYTAKSAIGLMEERNVLPEAYNARRRASRPSSAIRHAEHIPASAANRFSSPRRRNGGPRFPCAVPPSNLVSVVEHGGDLGVADIRLVVPIEAGVGDLRQLLALERFGRGLHGAGADADRVLGDGAGHLAGLDRGLLLLAGIVADDDDLLLGLFGAIEHADRRTFVGAEDPLDVRVGLQDRLGDLGRLQLVAAAILHADDLDVGVLVLHRLEEAVAAIDAGAAGLV